jgi:hypothetical protein
MNKTSFERTRRALLFTDFINQPLEKFPIGCQKLKTVLLICFCTAEKSAFLGFLSSDNCLIARGLNAVLQGASA